MQRTILGIVALTLLTIGLALWILGMTGGGGSQSGAMLLRMGIVLGVVWLALPDAQKWQSKAVIGGIAAVAIILARWPKLFPLAILLLIAVAVLRPRLARPGAR